MKDQLQLPDEFRLFAPWERAVDKILSPIEEFIKTQTASAMVLMVMTVVALVLANSPVNGAYHHFFEKELALVFGSWELRMSLHHWINDGLMAFFFFLIGLEIKREILVGELSDFKAALLPVIAAIGGMIFPAIIYALVNHGEPTIRGWGIPMATDIAFAISVLVLLRRYVPSGLVTFLIALAIVDDLGAVIIIALFYTHAIDFKALGGAFGVWTLLWTFNRAGIYHGLPYFIGGTILWLLMLASGVHATIAGVLTAFTVPTRPKLIPGYFKDVLQRFLKACEAVPVSAAPHTLTPYQKEVIQAIHTAVRDVQPPSLRMEHALHLPVALVIIPLFALANAGIHMEPGALAEVFAHPVSLGIVLGLVVGKTVGIAGTAWLVSRLGLAFLPTGVRPSQLVGVGFLAGIGFTMCLFITELAWPGEEALLQQAKMGILLASLLAGIAGYLWLRFVSR
ncbi:Na+/H+ antiporter NhaA [Thermosulfurimonas dismutans]|uniref:Na(+)/H(+) antiporter NhaA n=1 Tax=Thermosulfurimonas dismutans TaxID=999894 RepID=A0A179D5B9_9BACT|nr:Na+/H+ antiporter NhaA [Thermosulfurimonas dismutans]OAQ20798.1 Na+/H+ antiporter NhaA type [Thermosulfurimonas dismutans]